MLDAAIAVNRFGLGGRLGEPIVSGPRHWLLDQFDRFDPAPAEIRAAPPRSRVANSLNEYAALHRDFAARKRSLTSVRRSGPASQSASLSTYVEQSRACLRDMAHDYDVMASARVAAALTTIAPFPERLVHFWANHFAVSADKPLARGMAGLLEYEAIRPHLLGSFSDMLLAVEQHPAMLLYLDQVGSIGPNSPTAQAAERHGRRPGFNENLGREILELHTVGVHGGYTQADVTEFARALTGWSVAGINGKANGSANQVAGGFYFERADHEPGARTVMGRRYPQVGEDQAFRILRDLAMSRATAWHLATKLTRHFAADDPPASMVARVADTYLQSGGDLPSMYRSIVDSPEAWGAVPKFKTPWEWLISAWRALGDHAVGPSMAVNYPVQLGQPIWKPRSPAGWDDVASSWAGPNALLRRVEVAQALVDRADAGADPRELANMLFGSRLSDRTHRVIAAAESRAQGLALVLVAPEFLRR